MTHQEPFVINSATKRGFSLLETIIYVALFGILMAGILGSVYPLLTGSERTSARVIREGESAFIIRKINTVLSSATAVTTPTAGNSGGTLVVASSTDSFTFAQSGTSITYRENGGTILPLTNDRVLIMNFSATHTAPTNGIPRYVEYTFIANGTTTGPVRKYLSF